MRRDANLDKPELRLLPEPRKQTNILWFICQTLSRITNFLHERNIHFLEDGVSSRSYKINAVGWRNSFEVQ